MNKTPTTSESHVDRASQIIDSWPEWKRNYALTKYDANPSNPSNPTTTADKLASPLVKYIKERNPRLGIAKIRHLLELQYQYADSLKHKDLVAAELAFPLWDCTLLGSFSWGISYAPSSLWEALEYGKHNVYSLRSIIGNHII